MLAQHPDVPQLRDDLIRSLRHIVFIGEAVMRRPAQCLVQLSGAKSELLKVFVEEAILP